MFVHIYIYTYIHIYIHTYGIYLYVLYIHTVRTCLGVFGSKSGTTEGISLSVEEGVMSVLTTMRHGFPLNVNRECHQ